MNEQDEFEFRRRLEAEQANSAPGVLASIGAGLGKGVGQTALGLQHYVGKGVQALGDLVGPAPTLSGLVTGQQPRGMVQRAGDWLVNDAATGRQKLESQLQPYKDANPVSAGGGELVGQIAATLPVGGVLAAPLKAAARGVPALAPLADAVATSGMRAGGMTGAAGLGVRAAGGAATGGASAALVTPGEGATGAAVGAAMPGAIQLAGKAGRALASAARGVRVQPGAVLAEALGVSPAELPGLIAAARKAPDAILPGSKLTLAQALELQGASAPAVKMLERIAAGGPGGDALLRRYEEQAAARMAALEAEGAQVYQGAAKEEATRAGDKIGAILRTQASDDQAVARQAWEALHGRAVQDGVALRLPLDEMTDAMTALGPGTVGAGKDAQALLREAQKIGTLEIPPVTFGRAGGGAKSESLLDAVKRAGGINQATVSSQLLGGEVQSLREGGLGRVVYKNRGQSVAKMAEKMHEAGFIPDEDPATLIDMLRSAGRTTYSSGANLDSMYRQMAEAAMGDAPTAAQSVPVAVPFADFQRLRRSAGELSAKPTISPTEGQVLGRLRGVLEGRVDDAAAGNLFPDEVMPQGFREQYNAARDLTRANAERYKGGNNISAILRKPVGQDYTLTGDEITNKLWHGGAGLAGDVRNLVQVLSVNNREPAMDSLRRSIMTEAASKTTAGGNLGSALPRYVEGRMPGLQEALTPSQLEALSKVAADIRNAEAAATVPGLRGSDTQAKLARALDGGLLDGPAAKFMGRVLSVKGVGGETVRAKLAEAVAKNKGQAVAELFSDPKAAAAALEAQQGNLQTALAQALLAYQVGLGASRAAPVLSAR